MASFNLACKIAVSIILVCLANLVSANSGIRLKDFARIDGGKDTELVGYGIVAGLAGTGDTARNRVTLQSLSNTLSHFGIVVEDRDLNSRNVASVIVTARLPAFTEPGDRIDVRVASTGDAKSLSGGTLLLAPLYGPDKKLYALSQGSLTVGGYEVESFSNFTKKNHVTVGQISGGATVERASPGSVILGQTINVLLNNPDYTTANRLLKKITNNMEIERVSIVHPGKLSLTIPNNTDVMSFLSTLENLRVVPDIDARVVVNERTGSIVAGSNVILGEVSIAYGDLRIEVETKFEVSQPQFVFRTGDDVSSVVTPDTKITVTEGASEPVLLPQGTTVGELVQALNIIRLSTRDIIGILQSIKAAGSLHAELIIQ